MARAAVYSALKNQHTLQAMNVKVLPNYSSDTPPSTKYPFLILRWEETALRAGVRRGPTILTIWAHCPRSHSTDYSLLDAILSVVEYTLVHLEQEEGNDGQTVTTIIATGRGGDLFDPGFDTITKNSAFEVLHHATV